VPGGWLRKTNSADMSTIFQTLYNLHPLLPMVYLVIMGNGLIGPAIYCAVCRVPYDITRILELAREGAHGARYALFSWGFFAVASVLAIALSMYF